jgi:hypothetical protein
MTKQSHTLGFALGLSNFDGKRIEAARNLNGIIPIYTFTMASALPNISSDLIWEVVRKSTSATIMAIGTSLKPLLQATLTASLPSLSAMEVSSSPAIPST